MKDGLVFSEAFTTYAEADNISNFSKAMEGAWKIPRKHQWKAEETGV